MPDGTIEEQLHQFVDSATAKAANGLSWAEIAEICLEFGQFASSLAATLTATDEAKLLWVCEWFLLCYDAVTAAAIKCSPAYIVFTLPVVKVVRLALAFAVPGVVRYVYKRVVKPQVST